MKNLFIAVLTAFVIAPASAQDYLDLDKDPFVQGGLKNEVVSKELLPAFAGYAPKVSSDEVVVFSFNYDIPKLQLAFRDSRGRIHTRTGKLKAGEELVATINSRQDLGNSWRVNATVRWARHCGNPLPYPFEVNLTVPKWGKTRIDRVEVPAPYPVTVKENTIIQQLVPTVGNIELVLPPPERGRYHLTEVGHLEAGRRWEYQKTFWEGVLDFLRVVAFPIAEIIKKAPSISITATGGTANSNSSSSSSSSASASASAAASAAAAAAADGGGK